MFPASSKRSLWYQRRVRVIASLVAVTLGLAGCGSEPGPSRPAAPPSTPVPAARIDPANLERVRRELPAGYEVATVDGRGTPLVFWGVGPDWTADPPPCGPLADPAVDPATARGWSASGDGGIVYAVVSATPQEAPGPELVGQCGQWTLRSVRTSATVTMAGAPPVDGASTLGMATAATTVVEGGTQTRSRADTYTAYLPGYVVFVTVVTDPGSPNPPLAPEFAAALLVKTVSALRG